MLKKSIVLKNKKNTCLNSSLWLRLVKSSVLVSYIAKRYAMLQLKLMIAKKMLPPNIAIANGYKHSRTTTNEKKILNKNGTLNKILSFVLINTTLFLRK